MAAASREFLLKQLFIYKDHETEELSFSLFDNRYNQEFESSLGINQELLFISTATDDGQEMPLLFLSANTNTNAKKIEICPLNTINTDSGCEACPTRSPVMFNREKN